MINMQRQTNIASLFLPQIKQEPGEYTPSALDLCVRKRPASPEFHSFGSYPESKRTPVYIEPPSSSLCSTSPNSNAESELSDTSSGSDPYTSQYTQNIRGVKPTRPFKAYPKDPMSLAIGGAVLGQNKDAYSEFRQRMLSQVQASNNGTNKNMRRISQSSNSNGDPTYWEKRRKNNEAAKRSRDARRAKEDEIAIRCAFLEQENIQLKFRLAALENERDRLQHIYN